MAENWLEILKFQHFKFEKEQKQRERERETHNSSCVLPGERDKLILLFLAVGSHYNIIFKTKITP